MPRPALNAPDEEWLDWIEFLEDVPPEENPEDDPVSAQALAEANGVLKERAIQAAGEALNFTDEEMQAVRTLADPFYRGIWYPDGELSLSVNWNKPHSTEQCFTLRITRNDEQVLVKAACILHSSLREEEPIPVLKPDFSRQYPLFPESEPK